MIYEALIGAIFGLAALTLSGFKTDSNPKGILFAGLTGVMALLGAWFYVNAAARGKISLVVTVTGLYPVITVLLSYFLLNEPLELKQMVGVLFAVVAIVLVAT